MRKDVTSHSPFVPRLRLLLSAIVTCSVLNCSSDITDLEFRNHPLSPDSIEEYQCKLGIGMRMRPREADCAEGLLDIATILYDRVHETLGFKNNAKSMQVPPTHRRFQV